MRDTNKLEKRGYPRTDIKHCVKLFTTLDASPDNFFVVSVSVSHQTFRYRLMTDNPFVIPLTCLDKADFSDIDKVCRYSFRPPRISERASTASFSRSAWHGHIWCIELQLIEQEPPGVGDSLRYGNTPLKFQYQSPLGLSLWRLEALFRSP